MKRNGKTAACRCPAHDDKRASLSISEGEDGRALVSCHAGCEIEEIVSALGLKTADLFPQNGDRGTAFEVVATYDYKDGRGKLLFQVVRLADKGFRQRRPDGSGRWSWALGSVRRVPYRLPELLMRNEERVFVTEGEKDADRLHSLGLLATTNPGGAGKWRADYNEHFKGRDVVVLPDNDDPGRAHADKVAAQLSRVASTVKVVEIPGLPEKGDVSDWLDASGDPEKLLKLVEAAPETAPSASEYPCTDVSNARRFSEYTAGLVRFCHEWGQWLVWDRTRFQIDPAGRVIEEAKRVVRGIYHEAADENDADLRKKLFSWAEKSQSKVKIDALLSLARSEPSIAVRAERLDAAKSLFNVENGTLDLRTGKLQTHCASDLLTKRSPVRFDPDARCPRFLKFLEEIFCGDADLATFVQLAVGYSLTGDLRERCVFFLHGAGRNGKSTLVDTLMKLLGDYGARTPTQTLMRKKSGSIPNDLARLPGKRFVAASEGEEGERLAESFVKDITGKEKIAARFLHREWFEFLPEFKVWFTTNHLPVIRGSDPAIWDRVRVVPFNARFDGENEDKTLEVTLESELSGILNWALTGCLRWRNSGLSTPESVGTATGQYRTEMDVVGTFISEACVASSAAQVTAKAVYDTYKGWCKDNGEQPLTKKSFGLRLRERGFLSSRTRSERLWTGIGLPAPNEDHGEGDAW